MNNTTIFYPDHIDNINLTNSYNSLLGVNISHKINSTYRSDEQNRCFYIKSGVINLHLTASNYPVGNCGVCCVTGVNIF